MLIKKRDNKTEFFDSDKLTTAIKNAAQEIQFTEFQEGVLCKVTDAVRQKAQQKEQPVESSTIMKLTETELMNHNLYDVARELILFRERNKPDIFRRRVNYKPFEYNHLAEYVTAINHAFWLFSHYNYNGDVGNIYQMTEGQRTLALRAILAISQIEVAVKKFWGKIGDRFPKPEIEEVAATFAESEVRHAKAYSNLLQLMGIEKEFENISQVPAIQKRIKYLEDSIANSGTVSNQEYFKNIILFSILIESISLFSQFYIVLSFDKNKMLKGTANAIKATRLEEQLHFDFGVDLIKTIIKENPTWWTEELQQEIKDMTDRAIEAELEIVDWMYENGGDDIVSKEEVIEFLKDRTHKSLKELGIIWGEPGNPETFEWFNLGMTSRTAVDFFDGKDIAYTKGNISYEEDDLF